MFVNMKGGFLVFHVHICSPFFFTVTPPARPSAHAAIPTVPFRTLPNLNSFLISITSHPQSVQRRSRCERAQPFFRGVRPSSAPRSSEPVPLSVIPSVSASASHSALFYRRFRVYLWSSLSLLVVASVYSQSLFRLYLALGFVYGSV